MSVPLRPAWVEIDLDRLAENFRRIRADLPRPVRLLYVLKDEAYGQGAPEAARVALGHGADELAVYTLDEALALRRTGIQAPILLLGERVPPELPACLEHNLVPGIGSLEIASTFDRLAGRAGRRAPIQVKVNTGMNRFGFPWREVAHWAPALASLPSLQVTGVFGHFAQSDETDKSFAREQLAHFDATVAALLAAGIPACRRHHANSGGFLDLPESHLDLVRLGILPLGVYPSSVCRRIPGLAPVMSVKALVTAVQTLPPGDTVGYGMRWRADRPSRIAVLPLGYGDGFPRVRNEGQVLLRGRRVPIVGGVTMDALMVDITELPEVRPGDEAVLLGRQGDMEITVQELATLKRSVTYDVLVGWRARLPRRYLGGIDRT